MRRLWTLVLFGAGLLVACAEDDALVAMVDRVEVEVGGAVEFDPTDNDIWTERPQLADVAFDESGVRAEVVDGRLVIRNRSLPPGAVVEIPYAVDLDGRSAGSFVIVEVPEGDPPVEPSDDEVEPVEPTYIFELSRTSIDLGRRDVDGPVMSGDITITNTGTEPLRLMASSTRSVEAVLECPDPFPPGDTCPLIVLVGTEQAKVVADTVTLSAPRAERAELLVEARVDAVEPPPTLDVRFDPPAVELNLEKVEQTVVVTNIGDAPLRDARVVSASGWYGIAGGTCDGVLPVRRTCQFDVALTEQAREVGGPLDDGQIFFLADSFERSLLVSGDTTEPPQPEVALEPGFIQFADNNQPFEVTIVNIGNVPLRGLRISEFGLNGELGPFTVNDFGSCDGSNEIPPDEACRFEFLLEVLPPGFSGEAVGDQIEVMLGDAVSLLDVQIG